MTSTTHGGARQNSGRKPAPTKTVRVPAGSEAVAKSLASMALDAAVQALKEHHWYKTAPARFKTGEPEVKMLEIKMLEVSSLMGPSYMTPCLIFSATVGGITEKFSMRVDIKPSAHMEE